MATAKSKEKKASRQTAGEKSGSKRSTAKKPKRPPAFRKPSKRKRSTRGEIPGTLLLLVGVLMLFCLVTTSNGTFILLLRNVAKGAFGKLSGVMAVYLCMLGIQVFMGNKWPLRGTVSFAALLVIVCFAALLQVFRMEDILRALNSSGYRQNYNGVLWQSFQSSKNTALGGGSLGALLGYPLWKMLDVAGSTMVMLFLLGALCVWIVRMFMPNAPDRLGAWWNAWREEAAERRQERLAQRQEADEEPPLPEELYAPPPQPPRPSRKKQPAAVHREDAYPPPEDFARPAEPLRPAPPHRQQPTLYIEDILPDGRHEPYFDDDTHAPARPKRKKFLPDFMVKRRDDYNAAYGPLNDEEYFETPRDAEVAPFTFSADPGAPYREAFRAGARTVRADQAPQEAPQEDAMETAPASEPAVSAPEDAQEPDAAAAEEDGLPPWEPVAQEYDSASDPSRPSRRRRRQEYFPAGNVLDQTPQIPPQDRIDRPDWKPQPQEPAPQEAAQPEYRRPPFSLLNKDETAVRADTRDADARGAKKLEETLESFGVKARVTKVVHGPAITRYELQPAPGVKVSKIVGLTDDIALNMAAVGVRIEAPIPGKAAIGIEIANDQVATVRLRDVLESDEAMRHASRLAVALGKDIAGKRIIADLARMPHLLIAGATGSGKSVCINTIIASIIYRATPEEVRLILIDPKKVELSVYNGIPHLLVPVVTDPKKASGALNWAVTEMDERYKLFAACGVRDIRGYNAQRGDKPFMPSIVVIIDELSDLMLVAPGEVEESICRLAQLARACGIHLVVATQRPSVNVITGIIKANIPSRIAFAVSSQVDSRTILDGAGAEKLLGKGDMLFAPAGGGKPIRVQGCFVSDEEVQRVVEYVKDRHTAEYSQAVIDALSAETSEEAPPDEDKNDAPFDALFEQAVEMAVESGQASISMLQRRLRIGYARAGRIIDEMARRNIIGQAEGAKPREVLITREEMALLFPKKEQA